MKKRCLLFLVVLFTLTLIPAVSARTIDLGTYVTAIEEYSIETGSYIADYFVIMECDHECSYDDLFLVNGWSLAAQVVPIIEEPTRKVYRVTAHLDDAVELQDYPFDIQTLTIMYEHKTGQSHEVTIKAPPDISGLDPRLSLPGWEFDYTESFIYKQRYQIGEQSTRDRYIHAVKIIRPVVGAFAKNFVPVLLIVLIIIISFILGLNRIEMRVGISSSMLLAAVLLHLNITSNLPQMGYLTFIDKFMILTYLVAFGSFLTNITLLHYMGKKKMKLAKKIDHNAMRACLTIVPLLYILLFVLYF